MLPLGLSWQVPPASWSVDEERVEVRAAGGTDYFIDPAGVAQSLNGARATLAAPQGDWQFQAKVRVDFRSTYDAGVLMLWSDELHWAKLCFEQSPQNSAMVVSVVTREVSDDANAWVVAQEAVWLRISQFANPAARAYAFHSSLDGAKWDLVRYFALPDPAPMMVGIEAQSPMGGGCSVSFDHLRLERSRLKNLRDGS